MTNEQNPVELPAEPIELPAEPASPVAKPPPALGPAPPSSSNPIASMVGTEAPNWMDSMKNKSVDEVAAELNRLPLFMNTLDETGDGEQGENVMLEAIKALQYEGTSEEVALNFKEQGNERYKEGFYDDAVQYYTKALAANCGIPSIEESCYSNRAQCHLIKRNYGSCIKDCKQALARNNKNVKAWYRAAKAGYELGKLAEAKECAQMGLKVDKENKSLLALMGDIKKKEEIVRKRENEARAREEKARRKRITLELALKARGVRVRNSKYAPDMEDAEIHLEDEEDAATPLYYPLMFMYPLAAQTDFIKDVPELSEIGVQLDQVLENPPPWDEEGEYRSKKVDVFCETISGGLFKVGRKLMLADVVGNEKVEVKDGLVRLYVTPKTKSTIFIEEWKKRMGK